MKSTVAAFAIAFIISISLTPAVRRLAVATGALDEAGGRRVHTGRIPRLGGLAVAIAFFVPLVALFLFDSSLGRFFFDDPNRVTGLALGCAIVLALGAFDDVRGVPAHIKLAVQCIAALIAWWAGYSIHAVALPVVGVVEFGALSVVITILWFVGVINALNLIDGLDGLAAGIAFFACITNLLVGSVNESLLVVLLSAALGGALLGFLMYNFNPASIFMGDSGSMFLGFVLAASSLLGSTIKSSTTVAILVPVIALGVPITDTVWAFARRVKNRRSIFSADRGHIHHLLLDMGLSQRRAVILLYTFSLALTIIATGLALGRNLAAGAALIFMAVLLVGVVRTARTFTLGRAQPIRQRPRLPLVEELRNHLPELLRELNEPLSLPAMISALEGFIHSCGIPECLLDVPSQTPKSQRMCARGGDHASPHGRRIEYPLNRLGSLARITFWLRDSHNDDQGHILLQLASDAVERSLSKLLEEAAAASASSEQAEAHGAPHAATEFGALGSSS